MEAVQPLRKCGLVHGVCPGSYSFFFLNTTEAIASGVRAAVIVDGRVENACLLELFTSHGAGTLIKAI